MGECWTLTLATLRSAVAELEQPLWMLLAFVLMLGLLAALLLAPLLQRAYVKRVQRYMAFRELQPPPPAWWDRQAQRLGRPAPSVDDAASAAGGLAGAMHQRQARIRRATWAAWATLALGSLVLMPFYEGLDAMDALVLVAMVALLGAQPALVNLRPEGSKWLLLLGIALVTLLVLFFDNELDADGLIGAAIVVGVPYLVSVQRSLRAMVVPLTVLFSGLAAGVVLALLAMAPGECLSPGNQFQGGDWALLGLVLALALAGLLLALWAAARVLDALARLVTRGWLSDLSVVAASGVVLITGILALSTDAPQATTGLQLALWVLWCGAVLGVYALVLRRQPLPRQGRRLLMLRVFSKDRRAEALLDTLQARWQLAGPVMEIGGPDLVHLNMDIHEVIAFVNFRLHELFQPAAVPAEVLARSLDLGLDHEGRFRVNEVFCFDTSWKRMVERLMDLADVVLLDLRGFNPQRGGTAHEVERLAERGLLLRVVALYDRHTDWAWFDQRVAGRGPAGQALALKLDAADPQALPQCLDRLLALADAAPAARSPLAGQ